MTSSRPRPRPGRRFKLIVLLAIIAPSLLVDELTARAGVGNLPPQKVVIGRTHELAIDGHVYVRCNDPGCGGSTRHPVALRTLELHVELSFKPDDAARAYTFNVRANSQGSPFVPPLSGRLTLVDGQLTEKAKSDLIRGARDRCDDLEILDGVEIQGFQVFSKRE